MLPAAPTVVLESHAPSSIVPALAQDARAGHPHAWSRPAKSKAKLADLRKGGPPSITVSALSRDTCSVEGFSGFDFPFVGVF